MREDEIRGRYGHFLVPDAPSFEEGLRWALEEGARATGTPNGTAIFAAPRRVSVLAYDATGRAAGVLRIVMPRVAGVEMIATRQDARRTGVARRMWQAAIRAGYPLNDLPPGPMTPAGLRFWLHVNPRRDYEDD